jgi:hypothetical protein
MAPDSVRYQFIMNKKLSIGALTVAILLPVILVGIALLALWAWHDNVSAPPYTPAYSSNPAQPLPVPESPYQLVGVVTSGLARAEWLCYETPDRLWVGSAEAAVGLDLKGRLQARMALPSGARAMTADPARGCYYVALTDRVVVVKSGGEKGAEWVSPGKRALLTALACDERFVYAADAGQRVVWQFDKNSGELLLRLGLRDPERDIPGFIIPSPYFSLVMAPDGLLRVVNPGRHSIEAYTAEGHLEMRWGRASWDIEGFVGCCNPSYLVMFGDGRFVTSEKGLRRIKVYDAQGRFEASVATPDRLVSVPGTPGSETDPCPVAVDPRFSGNGRIWVLIPGTGLIRIFERAQND